MRTYRYGLVTSKIFTGDIWAVVYGVRAEKHDNGKLVNECVVEDIFCTQSEAEAFISLLQKHEVDPCNIIEVAEDILQQT